MRVLTSVNRILTFTTLLGLTVAGLVTAVGWWWESGSPGSLLFMAPFIAAWLVGEVMFFGVQHFTHRTGGGGWWWRRGLLAAGFPLLLLGMVWVISVSDTLLVFWSAALLASLIVESFLPKPSSP